jgi:hypothetical protein
MMLMHFLRILPMTTEFKSWASSSGLPTQHAVHAAAHVAAVIGSLRARVVDTRESYWRKAVGGQFSPVDLQIGESLLIYCGLIELRGDELVVLRDLSSLISSGDSEFAAVVCSEVVGSIPDRFDISAELLSELEVLIPDQSRRNSVVAKFGRVFDDEFRKLVGQVGEEIVFRRVQVELTELGYPNLVASVRHVSLYDDTAGYDIVAPCIDESERLLEVKSTTRKGQSVEIFLSRNEAMMGVQRPNWWLVICHVTDIEGRQGEILGWVQGEFLSNRLPQDLPGGMWQSVKIEIPVEEIVAGLPSAIP